jgi:hypothetical protein
MARLAWLVVAAGLFLALTGIGPEDRLLGRRAVAGGVATVSDVARRTAEKARLWRVQQAAPDDLAPPVDGSGVVLVGTFVPQDPTAMARLGRVSFEHAAVRFEHGLALTTGPERIGLAVDAWSATGRTFAALGDIRPTLQIEVRRVTAHALPPGDDIGCGPGLAPAWLAIRQEPRSVVLMLFTGPAAPGPTMTEAALCGAWRFDAEG